MEKDCTRPKYYAKADARQLKYHKKKKIPNAVNMVLEHFAESWTRALTTPRMM